MSELGDFIRSARKAAGLTQDQVGAPLEISRNAVANWERGENEPDIKHVSQLATILKVKRDDLIRLIESAKAVEIQPHQIERAIPAGEVSTGKVDFPVYAAAEGGQGSMVVSWDPIDRILRPAPMANVRNGYGIYVVGESMAPRFEAGDTALVNPNLPPRPNADVVLFKADGNGTTVGLIKRLVRATPTEWIVQQFNPEKTFTLLRSDWPECYVVVGRY